MDFVAKSCLDAYTYNAYVYISVYRYYVNDEGCKNIASDATIAACPSTCANCDSSQYTCVCVCVCVCVWFLSDWQEILVASGFSFYTAQRKADPNFAYPRHYPQQIVIEPVSS